MKKILFPFPGNEDLSEELAKAINAETAYFILRNFPDGESYVRILSDVKGKDCVILCTLEHPDSKLLPLFFLCKLLKEAKAKSICLVAPYLAYMRQDKEFNPGEAVTSTYFAELLSQFASQLITIDPHLHRRKSLTEIYSIPCETLHAARLIAKWIKSNISNPLLVGPDGESEQWVSDIAKQVGCPHIVLTKERKGDSNVEITLPDLSRYQEYTPVLTDDIISTASTMIQTLEHLKQFNNNAPVCVAVHAVFAGDAYKKLIDAGAKQVVTCNTIQHPSNKIDISSLLLPVLL